MKFAIVSDSHDNEPNIIKAVNYIKEQNIATVIHCGDITSAESMAIFLKNFSGKVHIVFGNSDYIRTEIIKLENTYNNIVIHGEVGKLEIDNKKIAWSHYPHVAEKLAQRNKYDLIFYGHDHTPFEKTINKSKLLNPGNLDGSRYKATFAIYDTQADKAELILLEKL